MSFHRFLFFVTGGFALFSLFSKGKSTTPAKSTDSTKTTSNTPPSSGLGSITNASTNLMQSTLGNQATGNRMRTQQSPEEIRREELAQLRDQESPTIASMLYQGLMAQAGQQTKAFLQTDKASLALRESLKKAAAAAVEANIDGTEGATEAEKADAKKYASSHVEKANVVAGRLDQYAVKAVEKAIPKGTAELLQAEAKSAFNQVAPQVDTPMDTQSAEAKKKAIKAAQLKANQLTSLFVSDIKKDISDEIRVNAAFLNSGLDVKDLGKDEIDLRRKLDGTLVEDQTIDTVYTNKLFEPIKQAVVMKLGVGRRGWRRSKQLNEFRQKMKDAAREQAKGDIDSQLSTSSQLTGKSDIAKQYYGMMAKVHAHTAAKGSVDTTMDTKAKDIVNTVLPMAATKEQLKKAAQTSAYDVARADQGAAKKIREAALSGARTKAIEILKTKQTEAVNEARKITKGDKGSSSGPDIAKQNALSTSVKEQVKTDDIAGQAIKHVVEADSLNSGLAKVGKLIDLAVPNNGDSASFEFELKIPVHESGAVYVLFGLGAEAEREDKELTVSSEVTFGAGFQTFGLDANFRAGVFLECQGKDSAGVVNLLSYGLYRQMRNIAPKAADYFWGQGGKSGMSETAEAELWAATIEEQDLQNDNYVDIGLLTRLQGEANAKVAKFEGSLGYKRLNRFNKEAVDTRTTAGFGNDTALGSLEQKAQDLGSGLTRHVIEGELGTEVSIAGTGVAFTLEGSLAVMNGKVREIDIGATGSIPFAFGEDASQFAQIASKVATPIAGAGKNLLGIMTRKIGDKTAGAKDTGNTLDGGTDAIFAIPAFDNVGSSLVSKIQGDETVNDTIKGWITGDYSASSAEIVNKIALANSLDLSIGFSWEWSKDAFEGWEISLEVGQTKSFEVDAEIVKFSVEKSKRLGKLSFGTEGVKGGLLGVEKV
jgi:hypothetical protein